MTQLKDAIVRGKARKRWSSLCSVCVCLSLCGLHLNLANLLSHHRSRRLVCIALSRPTTEDSTLLRVGKLGHFLAWMISRAYVEARDRKRMSASSTRRCAISSTDGVKKLQVFFTSMPNLQTPVPHFIVTVRQDSFEGQKCHWASSLVNAKPVHFVELCSNNAVRRWDSCFLGEAKVFRSTFHVAANLCLLCCSG